MRILRGLSISFILFLWSCVDPLFYDISSSDNFPITIYGRITNEPGPYQVYINRSFDVQSTKDLLTPVSARKVNIIDEAGVFATLKEVSPGIYQTDSTEIAGRIGGVYILHVEFDDGRIYESIPDTLLEPGRIDTIKSEFSSSVDYSGFTRYGFDVKVSGIGNQIDNAYYKWDLLGTFESITHPELIIPYKSQCYPLYDEGIPCNFYPPCTGLRNPGNTNAGYQDPVTGYRRVFPCTCCKCWYQFFNNAPILSDRFYQSKPEFHDLMIYNVPLMDWYFMFKVHVELTQSSITSTAFDFFHSIEKQKEAIGSLFQPVTGQVKNTFQQISGPPEPINGIFYCAAISRKSVYINRGDVPNGIPIPEVDFTIPGMGWISCLELFPNATNIKPDFWVD